MDCSVTIGKMDSFQLQYRCWFRIRWGINWLTLIPHTWESMYLNQLTSIAPSLQPAEQWAIANCTNRSSSPSLPTFPVSFVEATSPVHRVKAAGFWYVTGKRVAPVITYRGTSSTTITGITDSTTRRAAASWFVIGGAGWGEACTDPAPVPLFEIPHRCPAHLSPVTKSGHWPYELRASVMVDLNEDGWGALSISCHCCSLNCICWASN